MSKNNKFYIKLSREKAKAFSHQLFAYRKNITSFIMNTKGYYALALLSLMIVNSITTDSLIAQTKTITGQVYVDHNGNGLMDGVDDGHPVIRVHLYHDLNDNGLRDSVDKHIQTTISGLEGKFSIDFDAKLDTSHQLLVKLEHEDLPTDAILSASSIVLKPNSSTLEVKLGFQAVPVNCYAIGDGSNPDKVMMVNRISGVQKDFGGDLGTRYIEAMAVSPGGKSIFAINKEKLGKIDFKTGDFQALPDTMGIGHGAEGIHYFMDTDGLAFDPFTGKLYAAERRSRTRDLLFQLDTLTGRIVKNAFGQGIDYVVMDGEGIQAEIDGLAISPVNGKMYGINNYSNVTHYDLLVEIDKHTGVTQVIDTIKAGTKYLHDIEGLGFSNDGQLKATTGTSAAKGHADAIFAIDLRNAKATALASFNSSSDYESCDCLTGTLNKLSGKVYEDLNENLFQDARETGVSNLTVYLYKDNGDGKISEGDILVDSVYTDKKGHYRWHTAANVDIVLELKKSDLPVGYEYMGPSHQYVDFGSSVGGKTVKHRDFGVAHGSYLNEWFSFSREHKVSDPMWTSSGQMGHEMIASSSKHSIIGMSKPKAVTPLAIRNIGTIAGTIVFAGVPTKMQEKKVKAPTVRRMSMKDGLVVGIRLKQIGQDGLPLSLSTDKGFQEAKLSSFIGPAIVSRLLRSVQGQKTIEIKSEKLKAGTYHLQVFNRTDVCVKKFVVK